MSGLEQAVLRCRCCRRGAGHGCRKATAARPLRAAGARCRWSSAAMGRDIPVAFQGGWPAHGGAARRLQRRPRRQQLGHRRQRDNTPTGSGSSVAALAGGVSSLYTNWERNGSKWGDLPGWTNCRTGWPPTRVWPRNGNAIVGTSQGGTGALTMATFHLDRYGYAGSLSGFLNPSDTQTNGVISNAINIGDNIDAMGAHRSWAAGSGTTPTSTPTCWCRATRGCGSTAR